MKAWKTHVVVENNEPKLFIQQTTETGPGVYDPHYDSFSALSNLNMADIDGLVTRLQAERKVLEAMAKYLAEVK